MRSPPYARAPLRARLDRRHPPIDKWVQCARIVAALAPRQLNGRALRGQSPLHCAIEAMADHGLEQGDERALALLDLGADPDALTVEGDACLDLALEAGAERVSLRLMDLGARRSAPLPELALAARSRSAALVSALIARGADPEERFSPPGGGRKVSVLTWARSRQNYLAERLGAPTGVLDALKAAVEARALGRSSRLPKSAPAPRRRSL